MPTTHQRPPRAENCPNIHGPTLNPLEPSRATNTTRTTIQHRKSNSTPQAIGFAVLAIALLVALDFNSIVVITNLLNVLSCVLEQLAFLKLRMVEPHLRRPFRVPVDSASGLAALLLPPLLLGVFVAGSSLTASVVSLAINSVALLAGLGLYLQRRWCGEITYLYRNSEASEDEY